MKVLVIGATGNVGSQVVEQLAQRQVQVLAAPRTPGGKALPAGAEAVAFDLERPETFDRALQGVERAFVMARTGDAHADRVGAPLIEAMRRAGVRHVVDMTGMGIEKREDAPLRKLERVIEGSGMAFTHLRPNYFMQNFCRPPLLDGIVGQGVISVPLGDATISFVDVRDIAGVAVEALLSYRHLNRAYTVTGGASVTHTESAAAIAGAAGRAVTYLAPSEEQARRELLKAGMPAEQVERRLAFLAVARSGALARVSPDTAAVLGRAPITFQRFALDHAGVWRQRIT